MARTPEGTVKSRFKRWLHDRRRRADGGLLWFMLSDRYSSGLPDFVLIWDGDVTWVEAKAEGETLRPLQAFVAMKILKAGGRYSIVTMEGDELCLKKLSLTDGVPVVGEIQRLSR